VELTISKLTKNPLERFASSQVFPARVFLNCLPGFQTGLAKDAILPDIGKMD